MKRKLLLLGILAIGIFALCSCGDKGVVGTWYSVVEDTSKIELFDLEENGAFFCEDADVQDETERGGTRWATYYTYDNDILTIGDYQYTIEDIEGCRVIVEKESGRYLLCDDINKVADVYNAQK